MSQYQSAICRIGQFDQDDNLFEVVGAGFLVSDRHIFTCAHVVNAALGNVEDQADHPSAEISVEFPKSNAGAWLKCKVVYWLPMDRSEKKEDIAVLELLQPLSSSAAVTLPKQDSPPGSRCKAHGFPVAAPNGTWSSQQLKDFLLPPRSWGQLSKLTDETATDYPILPGFSGTMLWDEENQQVAGMVVAAVCRNLGRETAFVIPVSVLLEVQRSLKLFEFLSPCFSQISRQLVTAYLDCKPEDKQVPLPSRNLDKLLRQIEDVELSSCGFIWKFVAYIVEDEQISEVSLKIALTHWATNCYENFEDSLKTVRERKKAKAVKQGSADARSAVLVVLKPITRKENHFEPRFIAIPNCDDYNPQTGEGAFNLWTEDLPPTCSLDDIPELLSPCLEFASSGLSVNTSVEIFLPVGHLNTPVETWEIVIDENFGDTAQLGNQHCTVLRSYERSTKSAKNVWKSRWELLATEAESSASSFFITCNGKNLNSLTVDLTDLKKFGLCLTEAPSTGRGGPLTKALSNGMPAVLWIRKDLQHCDCLKGLEKILSGALKDLPQTVRSCWQAAYRSDVDPETQLEQTQLGHHLSLLWDNPKLPPPEPTQALLQFPT